MDSKLAQKSVTEALSFESTMCVSRYTLLVRVRKRNSVYQTFHRGSKQTALRSFYHEFVGNSAIGSKFDSDIYRC